MKPGQIHKKVEFYKKRKFYTKKKLTVQITTANFEYGLASFIQKPQKMPRTKF